MQSNGTFTAPALSINAFNRSQTTNDFYVSLFKPSDRLRWAGNVKKYSIRNGQIVDAAGQNAIDPATGFFREDAQSLWSPQADGADITARRRGQPSTGACRAQTLYLSRGLGNPQPDRAGQSSSMPSNNLSDRRSC